MHIAQATTVATLCHCFKGKQISPVTKTTLIKGAYPPVPKEGLLYAAHSSWRKTYNSPSFGTVSIQNSPPPSSGRARSNCRFYVFLLCPFFGTARYYIIAVPKKGHVGGKKPLQRPGFIFGISPFSHRKWSYFEVLIKLKKIGHTICDPYLI